MAQIQFKGKTFVQNHHLMVKYHELIPVKGKSLTEKVSLHDNLIIHGDNLKALETPCLSMLGRSNAFTSIRRTKPGTRNGFITIM